MQPEIYRQAIHIVLFTLVFFLAELNRGQMALLLLLLLLVTVLLLPRFGLRHYFYRQSDQRYSVGAISYFVSLLILVLFFPDPAVIAAWAALALGDGLATILGQKSNRPKLWWNASHSLVGSAAFMVATFLGSGWALFWLVPGLGSSQILTIATVASLVGAVVESLPLKINDNISVPLAVALVVMWL